MIEFVFAFGDFETLFKLFDALKKRFVGNVLGVLRVSVWRTDA